MWQFINALWHKEVWFERFARKHILIALGVAVTLGLIGGYFLKGGGAEEGGEEIASPRQVYVESVAELSRNSDPLPLVGTVTSKNEASINAEAAGEIVAIYRKLGDYVEAHGLIAEINNIRERASLEQAKAGVDSARASATILDVGGDRDLQLLEETRNSAVNGLQSAYDTVDDSIRAKLDSMFSNPRGSNPQFNILTSDNQLLINLNFKRLKITEIIAAQNLRKTFLSVQTDLLKEINLAETELRYLKDFVDDVILALNQGVPSQAFSQTSIDALKTTASSVRTALNSSLSTLSSLRDNLNSRTAQFKISEQQRSSGATTVSTSEASLNQALATFSLAEANLEKTLIRSPISGTINSFSLKLGDFVSLYQPVAVISNNAALELVSYVTEKDLPYLFLGSKVTFRGKPLGEITRIAPALDPKTKKIEIRVGLNADSKFLNGETISFSVSRAVGDAPEANRLPVIPLSALKITPAGSFVFSVEADNTLKAHPVSEGLLLGNRISIVQGLSMDMRIVTDARGLKEGLLVSPQTP